MNERIKELAKQADIKLDYFGYGVDIDGGNPNVSKFAKLIVRECASICDSAADNHADEITPLVADKLIIAGASAQAAKLSLSIKQHFGVE